MEMRPFVIDIIIRMSVFRADRNYCPITISLWWAKPFSALHFFHLLQTTHCLYSFMIYRFCPIRSRNSDSICPGDHCAGKRNGAVVSPKGPRASLRSRGSEGKPDAIGSHD